MSKSYLFLITGIISMILFLLGYFLENDVFYVTGFLIFSASVSGTLDKINETLGKKTEEKNE